MRKYQARFGGGRLETRVKLCASRLPNFDNIDHDVLMEILSRDIHDGRFLNLLRQGLEAGKVDEWGYKETHSGTPQGGILSPLLSNLHE